MISFKIYRFNNCKDSSSLVIINNKHSKETTLRKLRTVVEAERPRRDCKANVTAKQSHL